MHLDAVLPNTALKDIPALARAAEAAGFAAIWTTETQHDPFLPLALAAEHTTRLELGTAVAIGFARSPTTLAHTAWDLAALSGGRFKLGLGTQVKAHIERRFGMPWPESPAGKLREQIEALRAIWQAWQTGQRLNFRGEHYKLTLMTPFFNPGPSAHPHIPIYLAGVNTGLARLAGQAAEGFLVHPLHTAAYVREVLRPAIAAGAQAAGRPAEAVSVSGSVFVIGSAEEREQVRQQVSFYASTPSYRPVLAHHGWQAVGEALSGLAARGEWAAMPGLISDAMLAELAVEAPPAELAAALRARYTGLLDRLTVYRPFAGPQGWEALLAQW